MNQPTASWRLLLTTLLSGLILAAAGLLVPALQILLLIFAGVLFGIFLNGISRWLARHTPLNYRWAYAAVVLLLAALLIAAFLYTGTQIGKQASALWTQLQSAAQQLREQIRQYEWARQFVSGSDGGKSSVDPKGILPEVMTGARMIGWFITSVLVIGLVGLYVAYDPDLYKTGLVKLVPRERRSRATEVLRMLDSALGLWIVGRLISMCIIGIATAVFLSLMGVPLAIALGVLAALLTFIPNIGPIAAAVPQALLALQLGTTTAMYVIVFNVVLQGVESSLITPIVLRYEVTLPPAMTIFAQLLMSVLIGIIGLVVAAPLTVAVMVLLQMLYIQDRLGDPSPGELVENH